MEMHSSAIWGFIVLFVTLVDVSVCTSGSTIGPPVEGKPGVCPCSGWGPRPCGKLCSRDCDCPNNQKCCSTSCGHQCVAPYTGKPGVCPCIGWGPRPCGKLCYRDCDCPKNQKCCSTTGCGSQCVAPYTGKPGVCPRMTSVNGICTRLCSIDCDCPRNQKCCSYGCGHRCTFPILG